MQMQERLEALLAANRLCELEQGSKAKRTTAWHARVQKAIEKLERVPGLQAINEKFSDLEDEEAVQHVIDVVPDVCRSVSVNVGGQTREA